MYPNSFQGNAMTCNFEANIACAIVEKSKCILAQYYEGNHLCHSQSQVTDSGTDTFHIRKNISEIDWLWYGHLQPCGPLNTHRYANKEMWHTWQIIIEALTSRLTLKRLGHFCQM